eukprot:TRINITY_DN49208_c0_g1_i1.p1 TRINITY_DN49208_c0_g1~~TRINITY_DN49208_c0_g1_i1.p1  ORF type:complete len:217 (+),score=2.04 TRINITY_DN49208_c0_g1_i1:33-683(+)
MRSVSRLLCLQGLGGSVNDARKLLDQILSDVKLDLELQTTQQQINMLKYREMSNRVGLHYFKDFLLHADKEGVNIRELQDHIRSFPAMTQLLSGVRRNVLKQEIECVWSMKPDLWAKVHVAAASYNKTEDVLRLLYFKVPPNFQDEVEEVAPPAIPGSYVQYFTPVVDDLLKDELIQPAARDAWLEELQAWDTSRKELPSRKSLKFVKMGTGWKVA